MSVDEDRWSARYVALLTAELALRGVDLPEDTLAAMVDHNTTLVASLAGISERDARLTINADAVPRWAEMIAQAFPDDEPDQVVVVRLPMATTAKVAAALSQCIQMLEARLGGHHTARGAGGRLHVCDGDDELVEMLLWRCERTRQLSRYLATVLAETAFTTGDVLVEAGFHTAAITTFTEILEGGEAEDYDRQGPGRYCGDLRHPHAPVPEGALPCGHALHSLAGILAATLTELQADHIQLSDPRLDAGVERRSGGDSPMRFDRAPD